MFRPCLSSYRLSNFRLVQIFHSKLNLTRGATSILEYYFWEKQNRAFRRLMKENKMKSRSELEFLIFLTFKAVEVYQWIIKRLFHKVVFTLQHAVFILTRISEKKLCNREGKAFCEPSRSVSALIWPDIRGQF